MKKAVLLKDVSFIFQAKEVKFGGAFGDARVKSIFEAVIQTGVNAFTRVNGSKKIKTGQVRVSAAGEPAVYEDEFFSAGTIMEEYYTWVVNGIEEATYAVSTSGEAVYAAAWVLRRASMKFKENLKDILGGGLEMQITWENPRKAISKLPSYKYANGVDYLHALTCYNCLNHELIPLVAPDFEKLYGGTEETCDNCETGLNWDDNKDALCPVGFAYRGECGDAYSRVKMWKIVFKWSNENRDKKQLSCNKGIKLEMADMTDNEKASNCKYFIANNEFTFLADPIISPEDIKTRPTPERLEEIARLHGLEVYWEIGSVNKKYKGYSYVPTAHANRETKRIRLDPALKEFTYEGLETLAHEILHFYLPKEEYQEYTNIRTEEVEEHWVDIHPMEFTLAEMAITGPIYEKANVDLTKMLNKYDRFSAVYDKTVKEITNDKFVDDIMAKVAIRRERLASRKRARFTSIP